MNMRRRVLLCLLSAFLLGVMLLAFALNHKTTFLELRDPSGRYLARITFSTFLSFIPMSPGSSGDKPGFVEIFDRDGESMGRIPVPMLQLSNVQWTPTGAEVLMIGSWDFAKGECYYWTDMGNKKIYVRR
jgi:hypothetical protein